MTPHGLQGSRSIVLIRGALLADSDFTLRSNDGASSLTISNVARGRDGGATFNMAVESRGFAGLTFYALEPSELAQLLRGLQAMHETLQGSALMQLHMEEDRVAFSMDKLGKVLVSGTLVHYTDPIHRLEFGFWADQTQLPGLIRVFASR